VNLIIAGGRDFIDYELLKFEVDKFIAETYCPFDVIIVSGHALGADTLGEDYADENGLQKIIKKAKWKKYGLSAGFKRNLELADNGSHLIAFWDGLSDGTKSMIDIANERGIETRIIGYTL
jgi:hypothetical protein